MRADSDAITRYHRFAKSESRSDTFAKAYDIAYTIAIYAGYSVSDARTFAFEYAIREASGYASTNRH